MTRHRFLAIDEGLVQLLHVDESHPENDWAVPIGHPQARDMQLIGGGRSRRWRRRSPGCWRMH